MSRAARIALSLGVVLAASASASDDLIGLCSAVENAHCATTTSFAVQEAALTPTLVSPLAAPAQYQITVTEGATAQVLTLTDVLTLDGLIATGTNVTAIVASVQKLTADGYYTTVASVAAGDLATACGCPYVPSSMTLEMRGAGSAGAGGSLLSLSFGESRTVALDLRWDLGEKRVHPGDTLRLQPCVVYAPQGVSLAPGCSSESGGVRAVKACSALPFAVCPAIATSLVETLGGLSGPVATLGPFTAATTSTSLTPPSIVQQPGGAAVSFAATPSGVPGTTSVITVQGSVSCSGAPGEATLGDTVSIAGQSASASIAISCPVANPCAHDVTPPVVACPAVGCLTLSSCAVASETPAATATDDCGPVTATCTAVVASPADVGSVLETVCTATDAAGNVGSVSCPAYFIRPAPPPAPLAMGDFCTYTQHGWQAPCTGASGGCVRDAQFSSTFAVPLSCAAKTGLTLGLDVLHRASFSSAGAVRAFLTQSGPPGALNAAECDPTGGASGALGGELLALKLNVRFSDVDALPKKDGTPLGELLMSAGPCRGFSVRQILARGEQALSGGANEGTLCATLAELTDAAAAINGNFDECAQNMGELVMP